MYRFFLGGVAIGLAATSQGRNLLGTTGKSLFKKALLLNNMLPNICNIINTPQQKGPINEITDIQKDNGTLHR